MCARCFEISRRGFLAGGGAAAAMLATGTAQARIDPRAMVPLIGPGYTLPAYAAVFLGAVAIRPGTVNVWGTVIAIVFLAVLNNGLSLAGASPYVANVANGLALLTGVALANALARKRGRVIETA